MGYVTREMIDRAKKMDLLTYLQTYEPQELVHFGGNTYCTREHDSLKISNGKWCWFSRGIGGKTALDYLIKVKELPFTEAVERIVGRAAERPSVFHARAQPEKPKTLLLPPKSIIFSLFASTPPVVDPNAAAVTQVWSYIGELIFNLLVLVGTVKMADRIVREMMGL